MTDVNYEQQASGRMYGVFPAEGYQEFLPIAAFGSEDDAKRFIAWQAQDDGFRAGCDLVILRMDVHATTWNSVDPDPKPVFEDFIPGWLQGEDA